MFVVTSHQCCNGDAEATFSQSYSQLPHSQQGLKPNTVVDTFAILIECSCSS